MLNGVCSVMRRPGKMCLGREKRKGMLLGNCMRGMPVLTLRPTYRNNASRAGFATKLDLVLVYSPRLRRFWRRLLMLSSSVASESPANSRSANFREVSLRSEDPFDGDRGESIFKELPFSRRRLDDWVSGEELGKGCWLVYSRLDATAGESR